MFVMLPGSGGTGVSPAAGSGAAYTFASNSDFVGMVDFNTNGASNVASTIRTYEATRDLIDTIENKWSSTSVSKYDYDSDVLGRRSKVANTGTAFSTNRFSLWGYNDRSELTSAKRYDCNTSGSCLTDSNTNSPVSGQQFTYAFDNIGNRTEDTGDPDANTTGYTANNLNQYTATTSPTESFTYDNDGNLTQDALWDYVWDAENRLITITARNPTSGSKKLGFDYDHMNRRVRKRVYTWNTFGLGFWNTTPSVDRKFVYDGWNLIEELNGLSSDAIITRFTWGLDLSGQSGSASVAGIHGAGGIGGLLACNDNSGSKNYIYFYNANGDVGQLMDVAGGTSTTAVKYEYYPYGGELLASGLAALVSPFRFSTKYWDAETQNLYYGYRYLRPKMGRWTPRDPVGERYSQMLYLFTSNQPINRVDLLGLCVPGTKGGITDCEVRIHAVGNSPTFAEQKDELIDALTKLGYLDEFADLIEPGLTNGWTAIEIIDKIREWMARKGIDQLSPVVGPKDLGILIKTYSEEARGRHNGWTIWTRIQYEACVCKSYWFFWTRAVWEEVRTEWRQHKKGGVIEGDFDSRLDAMRHADAACDDHRREWAGK